MIPALDCWKRASSNAVVNASAYERWSRLRLMPAAGPLTAQAALTRELATVGGKADATGLSGRHTWKIGADIVSLRPRRWTVSMALGQSVAMLLSGNSLSLWPLSIIAMTVYSLPQFAAGYVASRLSRRVRA